MKFCTNKEKGNIALGMAIAFFTSQAYTVRQGDGAFVLGFSKHFLIND